MTFNLLATKGNEFVLHNVGCSIMQYLPTVQAEFCVLPMLHSLLFPTTYTYYHCLHIVTVEQASIDYYHLRSSPLYGKVSYYSYYQELCNNVVEQKHSLQVFAIEFGDFAIEFVPFAIEFVAFAIEFVPFAIEFVAFAVKFVRNKNGSWSKHENMM